MLCPSCNSPNRDDAKFCKGCGYRFTAGAVQVPEAVAARPGAAEDPELAPTQILSPEQMIAYHTRRWQQDAEREETIAAENSPAGESAGIPAPPSSTPPAAQEPSPVPATPSQAPESPPDIADMPTVVMAPAYDEEEATIIAPPPPQNGADRSAVSTAAAHDEEATSIAPPPPSEPVAAHEEIPPPPPPPAEHGEVHPDTTSAEPDATIAATPALAEKEGPVTQSTPEQPASTGDFPVLAVGSTLLGRYEVTSVLSEGASEHVYQVIDHQGYQRCWNCGSEQNAEGDEFCIDCGAALLDATYVMHEYSAAELKEDDANVLRGAIANTFVDQGRTYMVESPQTAQNSFPNGVHLLAACDSDAGNVRRSEPNEDSTLVLQLQRNHESISSPVGVFIVADGLGGHDNGQVASHMTITIIAERMVRDLLGQPLVTEKAGEAAKQLEEDDLVALLQGAVEDANAALCQVNQRDKTDMGSTITGFMMVNDHAYVLNVGDSRTYMMRGGQIYQLTNDHSLVGQLVAGGLIQPDDVYTHPQRSQIYRSLGDKLNVQIDIFKQQVLPSDILLSCSDGLWEMVRNPQIESILNGAPNPQVACTQLIEAANTNGGEDNVSAVVVFVQ